MNVTNVSIQSVYSFYKKCFILVAFNEGNVTSLYNNKIIKTNYKTFIEYLSNRYRITGETIEVKIQTHNKREEEIKKITAISENSPVESRFDEKL